MASAFSLLSKRSFSISSIQSALIRPPIKLHGLTGNYASALYSAAVKEKVKDNVTKDLGILQDVLKNQKVSDYMNDPFVPTMQKLSLLEEAAAKAGMSKLSINFFGVLAENNRMNILGDIAYIFNRINSAEKGQIPAKIVTAQPLDAKQKKELNLALTRFVEKGQTLVLEEEVNPDIMGGLVADIGDEYTDMKHIDMSTSSKVNKYLNLIRERV